MADSFANMIVDFDTKERLYEQAVHKMEIGPLMVSHSFKIENYRQALELLRQADDYLDAKERAKQCEDILRETQEKQQAYAYKTAVRKLKSYPDKNYAALEQDFAGMGDYKEAVRLRGECSEALRKETGKQRRHAAVFLALLLALVCALGWFFSSGAFIYAKGRFYMTLGMYSYAMDNFDRLGGKFQTDQLSFACKLALIREGEPNTSVRFGDYKWKILDKSQEEQTAILIAADIGEGHDLRAVSYHETDEDVTWENCSLRRWLNEDILEGHFSEDEKARIQAFERPATVNETYSTAYSETVTDYLALLSAEEIEQYQDIVSTLGNDCWVRTPGHAPDTAVFITSAHVIRDYGVPVTEKLCVRPVIKVSYAD